MSETVNVKQLTDFYKNKKIFISGNTGFKGAWISHILLMAGADICGYSDKPGELFELLHMDQLHQTVYGDVRDYDRLKEAIVSFNPDLVIHLAAQPLVITGYHHPRATFDVNVMGTVNLLSSLAYCSNVGGMVNVTTDKVYRNLEIRKAYCEEDQLGGRDPYSASKACSEIVTAAFRESYDLGCGVATARAGNVIGGGDHAANRLIPDCVRAALAGKDILVRNPASVRPWQHVLEPLMGYLLLLKGLYEGQIGGQAFNFGPEKENCVPVEELAELFSQAWGGIKWNKCPMSVDEEVSEAKILMLDSAKAQDMLGWRQKWNVKEAVRKTVDWEKSVQNKREPRSIMCEQIKEYMMRM